MAEARPRPRELKCAAPALPARRAAPFLETRFVRRRVLPARLGSSPFLSLLLLPFPFLLPPSSNTFFSLTPIPFRFRLRPTRAGCWASSSALYLYDFRAPYFRYTPHRF